MHILIMSLNYLFLTPPSLSSELLGHLLYSKPSLNNDPISKTYVPLLKEGGFAIFLSNGIY